MGEIADTSSIHNDVAVFGAIKQLEVELEKIKERLEVIRHMLDLQNSWNEATSTRVELHSKRLSALESPAQPECKREWIAIPNGVWVTWKDGTVTCPGYLMMEATHIMPYHHGDIWREPEAPKGERCMMNIDNTKMVYRCAECGNLHYDGEDCPEVLYEIGVARSEGYVQALDDLTKSAYAKGGRNDRQSCGRTD